MTPSPFKLLCQSCGLTMDEAINFLNIRHDTGKSWWLGRRNPPEEVLRDLHSLHARIDDVARNVLATIDQVEREKGELEKIAIGVAVDDHEAHDLGWPCIGATAAIARIVLENLAPDKLARVIIVPRGSTPETAAAADAHKH